MFLDTCKNIYGEVTFAQNVNSVDPYDRYYHPKRVDQPFFTSQDAVSRMLTNIGPGMKLIKRKETQKKLYTSYKKERSWKSVIVPDPVQVSNTSPLTGTTNSQIENIKNEVQELRKMLIEERMNNKKKYDEISKSVDELRREVKRNRSEQQNLTQVVREAVDFMRCAVGEMKELSKRTTEFEYKIQKHFCIIGKPIPSEQQEKDIETTIQDMEMSENKRLRDDRIIEEFEPTREEPQVLFPHDTIKVDGKKRLYKIRPGQPMREGQVSK